MFKRKQKKLFKKKLAYLMWEYENETKRRIDNIERALSEKGIMTIYKVEDIGRNNNKQPGR